MISSKQTKNAETRFEIIRKYFRYQKLAITFVSFLHTQRLMISFSYVYDCYRFSFSSMIWQSLSEKMALKWFERKSSKLSCKIFSFLFLFIIQVSLYPYFPCGDCMISEWFFSTNEYWTSGWFLLCTSWFYVSSMGEHLDATLGELSGASWINYARNDTNDLRARTVTSSPNASLRCLSFFRLNSWICLLENLCAVNCLDFA